MIWLVLLGVAAFLFVLFLFVAVLYLSLVVMFEPISVDDDDES